MDAKRQGRHVGPVSSLDADRGLVAPDETESRPADVVPRQIIQVEANLLHYPFFALHTKGLRDRKGIEVIGSKVLDGKEHEFCYRVTRNSDHVYPGPLARKVHFGLLAILSDPAKSSFPFENPIRFGWRELASAAGIRWQGSTTIQRMKESIASTHGVVITSNHALMMRSDDGRIPIPHRKRGYHLYEEYAFVNEAHPDGGLSDANYVWFSEWYLASLNAMFSGPLKYDVWQRLNDRHVIASRLYEYLLYKSRAKTPMLRINYPRLAPFLPVRVETFAAHARKQINPALDALATEKVITRHRWTTSKDGQIQLLLYLGPQLKRAYGPELEQIAEEPEDSLDTLFVREIPNDSTPADMLVREFHRQWSGNENHRPGKPELKYAEELLSQHDYDLLRQLVRKVVNRIRTEFPKAKLFGATRMYFPDVLDAHHNELTRRQREHAEQQQRAVEDQHRTELKRRRSKRRSELRKVWASLTVEEQRAYKAAAIDHTPYEATKRYIRKTVKIDKPNDDLLDAMARDRDLDAVHADSN